MKNFKIIVALVTLVGILCGFVACAWAEQYPRLFIVKSLNYDNDAILFCDVNGEEWEYYGIEDWEVNDVGAAIMEDNNTPTIYDDSIVKIYYQTQIEGWFE